MFPETCEQRCWVHKTANVLNKTPRSVQPKAEGDLHEIWQAETQDDANKAFDHFLEKFSAKYAQACECLKKDRGVLLTFYEFPAEHWSHLRDVRRDGGAVDPCIPSRYGLLRQRIAPTTPRKAKDALPIADHRTISNVNKQASVTGLRRP